MLSPEAREKRNAYMRKWRSKNKDKVRKYNKRYWEKQGSADNSYLEEWRCPDCNRLLGKIRVAGRIEIKCNKCKRQVVYYNDDVEVLEAL